jgi:hypothetical protein
VTFSTACGYRERQALEPYDRIPDSCVEIKAEMQKIADELGTTWTLRDAKDGVQIGLNLAVATGVINPGFAAANIVLQGLRLEDETKAARLSFLGHAYDRRGCWDEAPLFDPVGRSGGEDDPPTGSSKAYHASVTVYGTKVSALGTLAAE